MMNTLWSNGVVFGESAAFVQSNRSRMVFPVSEVIAVRNRTLGVLYEPGRDYRVFPESGRIERTDDSRIPRIDAPELYPDPAGAILYPAENANALTGGPRNGLIRYDGADFFARHQIEIDYRCSAELPRLCEVPFQVAPGSRCKLALIGDSITEGCNATGKIPVPPYAPPYADQVAEAMRSAGIIVEFRNFAVEGTGCAHGAEHLPEWLGEFLPDLLMIAYGMNDLNSYEPVEFAARISSLAAAARIRNPAMQILTVTPMPGNREWACTPPERSRAFAAALRALPLPCADVNGWWERLFTHKNFFELTGNGVNHPNDYGQRLYAAVVEDALRRQLR